MKKRHDIEILVIGAGPAGLGAGLGALERGARVLVVEKQRSVGDTIKGETIHFNQQMESILGKGFFDRNTIAVTNRRRYYSPTDSRWIDRVIHDPNLIFEWPDFMANMTGIAEAKGLDIMFSTEVVDLIVDNGRVAGARVRQGTKVREIRARAVVGSDGTEGITSRELGIGREKIDCPVLKLRVEQMDYPDIRLEYFTHIYEGDPPSVGYIFPSGEGRADIGLLIFKPNTLRGVPIPDAATIGDFFDDFIGKHPVFRRRMEGTKETYRLFTIIPMGGFIDRFVAAPGVVMVGDSAGQVEAKGGSGIASSFLIGHHVGKILGSAVKGTMAWANRDMNRMEAEIKTHPIYAKVASYYRYIRPIRSLMFMIHSAETADRRFGLISKVLR
ncbi:MAG: FAD-dependent monooxygenase [Deltaproteobacteria bacterium]|nr:FAD-dependent monooxygenase [Candidatus Zymogenaceae bacterium]